MVTLNRTRPQRQLPVNGFMCWLPFSTRASASLGRSSGSSPTVVDTPIIPIKRRCAPSSRRSCRRGGSRCATAQRRDERDLGLVAPCVLAPARRDRGRDGGLGTPSARSTLIAALVTRRAKDYRVQPEDLAGHGWTLSQTPVDVLAEDGAVNQGRPAERAAFDERRLKQRIASRAPLPGTVCSTGGEPGR